MAEPKRIDEGLLTAEVAGDGIPPKQPDGPKLVKVQEPETLDRAAGVSEPMPLFSESEMGEFRSQWSKIQTGFVDEPRRTVENADKLVAAVMQRLSPLELSRSRFVRKAGWPDRAHTPGAEIVAWRERTYEKAGVMVFGSGTSSWKPFGLLQGIHKAPSCVRWHPRRPRGCGRSPRGCPRNDPT